MKTQIIMESESQTKKEVEALKLKVLWESDNNTCCKGLNCDFKIPRSKLNGYDVLLFDIRTEMNSYTNWVIYGTTHMGNVYDHSHPTVYGKEWDINADSEFLHVRGEANDGNNTKNIIVYGFLKTL